MLADPGRVMPLVSPGSGLVLWLSPPSSSGVSCDATCCSCSGAATPHQSSCSRGRDLSTLQLPLLLKYGGGSLVVIHLSSAATEPWGHMEGWILRPSAVLLPLAGPRREPKPG